MGKGDLWAILLLVVLTGLGLIYWQARSGDVIAIAILAVLAVLLFLVLGGGLVLLVMDRMNNAEERRFRANAKENWMILQQQQQAMLRHAQTQNTQLTGLSRLNRDLTYQNQQLARQQQQEPDWGIDIDTLFSDNGDDVIDAEIDGTGRWQAR